MYYPSKSEEFPGLPLNVTYEVNREYIREASALPYETQVGLAGGFVPKYHGSWTNNFQFPGSRATRLVRLVLYEQIRGAS
jgi:hypothetical protein